MIHAYAGLFNLLLHHPERIGWLAHHAWHYHKEPLARLAIWSAITGFAVSRMRTISRPKEQ